MKNGGAIYVFAGAIGAIVLLSSFRAKTTATNMNKNMPDTRKPAGVTFAVFNQNPLNIKASKDASGNIINQYPGEITVKGAMHRMFDGWAYGTAAAFIHMWRYMNGLVTGDVYPKGMRLNTIEKIISTWAPKTDLRNDTEGYIRYIVQKTGIARNDELYFDELDMRVLIKAMAPREDGKAAIYVTDEVLKDAWAIAKTYLSDKYKV